MAQLSIDSDHNVYLKNLTLESDGVVQTGATVTFTLRLVSDDSAVSGADGISMPHVSAGTYRGVLLNTVSLTRGQRYELECLAIVGSIKRKFRLIDLMAGYNF